MAFRVLLVLLLVFAAACQTETSTDTSTPTATAASAPATRNVCDMLTVDELKTAAGLDGATGQSSQSGGADVCTWMGTTGKAVIVQVFPSASSYDQARSSFESLYDTTAADVTGIGEKAYFIDSATGSMPTGTLVVGKGSTPISVQVMGGSGDANTRKGEATAVAHVVLGKL